MGKATKYISIVLLIVLIGIRFGASRFNEYPSHIHAWAESDRIALSHGFVDNNLNFFQPQTYTLNHQFPDNFKEQNPTSRTSVDFPIHDFIPAIIMKLSGSKDIRIFQGYILLYSFIGMFFLFLLSELFVKNRFLSFGIVFLAVTSPIFIYYQGGFLPTIPSLSNAIIGLYFYFRYRHENKSNYFGWFIFFMTLSALARTTFAIPLIALCGIEALTVLRNKARPNWGKRAIYFVLAFGFIGGYFLYNSYLRAEYNSMFLNSFVPAENFAEIKSIISIAVEKWGYHYFSYWQYVFILVLIFAGFISMFIFKKKFNNEKSHFVFFLFIYLIGLFSFSYLLIRQFPQHDYYFLDTYFLWILLLLVFLLSFLPKFKKEYFNLVYLVPIFVLAKPVSEDFKETQIERKTVHFWSTGYPAMINYTHSNHFLDSLGIKKNAIILQLDATSPNGQLAQMERKGIVAMHKDKTFLQKVLDWKYDYIVCQNDELFGRITQFYPEILERLRLVGNNGKISVYQKKKAERTSLKEFIGIENKEPIASIPLDKRYQQDSTDCVFISSDDLYPLGAFEENADYLHKNNIAYISFNIRRIDEGEKSMEDLFMVSDINGTNEYTKHIPVLVGNSFQKIEFALQVPTNVSKKNRYGLYLFNNKEHQFEVDNFVFEVFDVD